MCYYQETKKFSIAEMCLNKNTIFIDCQFLILSTASEIKDWYSGFAEEFWRILQFF